MLEKAKWVRSPENREEACYTFHVSFEAGKKVKKAVLAVSAMGIYRAWINGNRVGTDLFTPYWTEYNKRVQYQTYDVTEWIDDISELCIECAEGWAAGYIRCGTKQRNHYADHISTIFFLQISYEDGTEKCVVSDENVKVRTSEIISSSIYHGEYVDKTVQIWELGNAVVDDTVKTKLIPQEGEVVTEQERIFPAAYIVTPKGERVIDFGQNLSGYVELTICGKRGDRITMTHAEVLDAQGNFYTDNLRSARQKNTYVLRGGEQEILKPAFCWQGFRYVCLEEYPSEIVELGQFCAVAVYSDIHRTGWFSCGNEKVNQLYRNVLWGQRCNFVDVPTDCPQRDERLGWTGDAQIFIRTAAINFQVEKFYRKWLHDLAETQYGHGGVGWMVPGCNEISPDKVSSGWGDAAVICPWEIYLAYGNKQILDDQYESMKAWVEYVRSCGEEEYLWLGGKHFGDWLALDNGEGVYTGATPNDYIASAYYAYSTSLLIQTGNVLGYDMTEYEKLYRNIVKAFREKFLEQGVLVPKTQTAHAIALYFGLCTNPQETVLELAQLIRENGTRLTTGFLGTPYLLHALSDNGYAEVAYDLLLQEEIPSWLYSVNHGATTMWEHWDGRKEDGTFWDARMNSFNHYAYGAVYDWIFGSAAGIHVLPDGAGYRHIMIRPQTDRRLGFLTAGIETERGKVQSSWYYREEEIHFELEIPKGTVAEVLLPGGIHKTITGGKYMFTVKADIERKNGDEGI